MTLPAIIPTAMPNGYNASITDFGGRTLMSYRYHPEPDKWRTRLMIRESGPMFTIEKHVKLPKEYEDMSQEDGRFFTFKNHLYLSLTVALYPGVVGVSPPCITIFGKLVEKEDVWHVEEIYRPPYGNNNFDGQSKNNVFFEQGGNLFQIYQCSPEQIVINLDNNQVHRSKSPEWEHGEIRGGSQPLEYKGKWLRFFHSLSKNSKNRIDWSYCIGAMIMSNTAPFQIEAISKWPVFSGDERYVPDCGHWKAMVAIVYGAIKNGDGWTISMGLNDCMAAVMNLTEKDLNLV